MGDLKEFLQLLSKPTIAVVVIIFIMIFVRTIIAKKFSEGHHHRWYRYLIMGTAVTLSILIFAMALPHENKLRGEVIGLLGILMSAMIALSSATFLGNAIAGVMLRSTRPFKSGDFISVNGYKGRVSARGVFHTEIQSDDRDLTTLPNLLLATNPVKVTNSGGTIIKTTVSLGYDEPRQRIEALLIEAATKAELTDPFVHIVELGDFSIVYKICGLLSNPSRFLSVASQLNAMVLDVLHENQVEIVSPNFMNTRDVSQKVFISKSSTPVDKSVSQTEPEQVIFDKAHQAEVLEDQVVALKELAAQCDELKTQIKESKNLNTKIDLEEKLVSLGKRRKRLDKWIAHTADEMNNLT